MLSLSSWCLVIVCGSSSLCHEFVIVVFPDHTHLLYFWLHISKDAEIGTLVKDALQDNYVTVQIKKDSWLSCVYMLLKDCNLLRFSKL